MFVGTGQGFTWVGEDLGAQGRPQSVVHAAAQGARQGVEDGGFVVNEQDVGRVHGVGAFAAAWGPRLLGKSVRMKKLTLRLSRRTRSVRVLMTVASNL